MNQKNSFTSRDCTISLCAFLLSGFIILVSSLPLSAADTQALTVNPATGAVNPPVYVSGSGTAATTGTNNGPINFGNGIATGTISVTSGTVTTLIYVSSGTLVSKTGTNAAVPFLSGTSIAYATTSGSSTVSGSAASSGSGGQIYWNNGQVALDSSGNFWYPNSNQFMDNNGILYYQNGQPLADDSDILYYSSGEKLADANSYLYYGSGYLFSDSESVYYSNGSYLINNSNPGYVLCDPQSNVLTDGDTIYYPGGDGTTLANNGELAYPTGQELADNAGRLYYNNNSSELVDDSGNIYCNSGDVAIDNDGNFLVNGDGIYTLSYGATIYADDELYYTPTSNILTDNSGYFRTDATYVDGVISPTGSITIHDQTGTAYDIPAVAH